RHARRCSHVAEEDVLHIGQGLARARLQTAAGTRGYRRRGRMVQGQRLSEMTVAPTKPQQGGTDTVETPSGKWRNSENFPVGSFLTRREVRPKLHGFYRFAGNADDIADNPELPADEKIRRLDRMAAVLDGASPQGSPAAAAMRDSLRETATTAQHCHDILHAF